ncbi:cupin domain-containing protein [Abyssalbus ytuae]|uniref:Cupin domain-containing protein n=1 Tax=Abyssalbus ytuae TaxID=2926907 RepID=A0A9E6ZN94_9FLAO|nr:cupin domain-containing protein [Abyssalbus ytuae]UOB17480.1 cupin domain-containing protein [Abyssalbus ytuae]
MKESCFPEIIDRHPSAKILLEGVISRLVQAGNQQFIFMEFEKDVEVPTHSHNAQWGVVLEGEMELTVNGEPRILKKGDSYFLEKGVLHSAKIKAGYKDLTLFDEADRYKAQ